MIQSVDRSGHGFRAALRRIRALIRKETWQLLRDPSSIAIGIVMPVALLVLFGYGINLDVKNVPVAIVMEENSAEARGLASAFELSSYFSAKPVKTMAEAEKMLLSSEARAILRIPSDFAREMASGKGEVQVVVNGSDANTARISLTYAEAAVGVWAAKEASRGATPTGSSVTIESRLWFN